MPKNFKLSVRKLVEKVNLSYEEMYTCIELILTGKVTSGQIGAFLAALSSKGETPQEIAACASIMQKKCSKICVPFDTLDIVGTGGDGLNTFNISTLSAIVTSCADIAVAKHGSRSVSGICGSADLLEAMGVVVDLPPQASCSILKEIGLCFMFSQRYYEFMANVNIVRRELGFRTIFNIAGPLVNPASANMCLIGVYDRKLIAPFTGVLNKLGVKRGMVVHGNYGQDEVSLCGTTTICELNNGRYNSFLVTPEQFGMKRCELEDLKGGAPDDNAKIALNILKGQKCAIRNSVALNSGFALFLSRSDSTLRRCVKDACDILDSGLAYKKFEELKKLTNKVYV